MPGRLISAVDGEVAQSLQGLREDLQIADSFPADVVMEAEAARPPVTDLDLRDVPFVTIDPPGSRDLDQALHLDTVGAGFRVRYAIADVPGFVVPGGAVDAEARRRGQTMYAADGAVPLHPPILSEDRASLLPDVDRSAFVWTIDLDGAGATTAAHVQRAMIRSRRQWDYPDAQRDVDREDHSSAFALLPTIGRLRLEQERARGGASLDLPDEIVVDDGAGGYRIERRLPLPVERYNAQLSLLTGMAAATMMLQAGIGILRTMPPPEREAVESFRAKTVVLGVAWRADVPYGEYLRSVDASQPAGMAVLQAAAALFRGAGYTTFDGAPPSATTQAAVAAPYAHVTAPLRRLVDRWGLVICEAVSNDRPVPAWVRDTLPTVPALMDASSQRASRLGAGTLDRVEAAVLAGRVGEVFAAIVTEVRNGRARLQLIDPVVTSSCRVGDDVRAGQRVQVRVVRADIATGEIEIQVVPG